MSSVQSVLRRLAQLTPEDRQWVLGRLPAEHKRKLLEAQNSNSVEKKRAVDVANSVALIDRASAQTMHALLATEPVWFAAAVLGGGDWLWRDEYFRHLSPVERHELQLTLQQSNSMTDAMKSALIEAIASRLHTAVVTPKPQEGRFESMLQKLAAKRSLRRWSGGA
jgi:non-ribosomal peptide synthetase component F